MPPFLHTLIYFLAALTVLIAIHEYGHFIVARFVGVKVLKFSIGFGRTLWRYQKSPNDTEYVIGILPLGGYVKMVDEREGAVSPDDLPHAFNRQPLPGRFAIVAAGPLFNFMLAILIYWTVFMLGETGIRPVLGPVETSTLAEQAGFREGDEILAVDGEETPTWNLAIGELIAGLIDRDRVSVDVRTAEGEKLVRVLTVPSDLSDQPDHLHERLGLQPWQPALLPVIDKLLPGSAAEQAGLAPGDLLASVDGTRIGDWRQWVQFVRERPSQELHLTVEREGQLVNLVITPLAVDGAAGKVGQIGASVRVPEDYLKDMQVDYRLSIVPALIAAVEKTSGDSLMTLKMVGRMLIGRASVQNLSGPISIAQIVGQAAEHGFTYFLRVLAIVSVSLAVLNLLPIPVLDGGHLAFYTIEAIKGSPVSERIQAACQQVGIFILLTLMVLAFYLDIGRLIG
ncbi:RIP metalloprotease RseP [Methylococcus sp. EFPC2]|uniref:RIP metalloprotease RseP n=1 Tax=Methylococcus sp. EFPC2 TaxID=2812648 RepID=UPI0019675758|nr:RIP metalloprotease RseP [Methylococcus sp. EFPC2]QSA98011.1 RIP metalloprotease RseP [Methylococcus sp. EFPC2]